MFCCLGSKVADIVFSFRDSEDFYCLSVIPKSIKKEPWRGGFWLYKESFIGGFLHSGWHRNVFYSPFSVLFFFFISPKHFKPNVTEKDLKIWPRVGLLQVQMKGVSNGFAVWCSVLCVLMCSGPPRLSHTAVPVLLISSNNHFNSISRKHQPSPSTTSASPPPKRQKTCSHNYTSCPIYNRNPPEWRYSLFHTAEEIHFL